MCSSALPNSWVARGQQSLLGNARDFCQKGRLVFQRGDWVVHQSPGLPRGLQQCIFGPKQKDNAAAGIETSGMAARNTVGRARTLELPYPSVMGTAVLSLSISLG